MTAPAFRCRVASDLRDEPMAGTASTVRAFLLLEHPGAWGVDALRDARLPDGLGEELRRRSAATGVRVLLVRRPGRSVAGKGLRVFAADADPHRPRLEHGTVSDPRELLDLDLATLRGGGSAGLTAYEQGAASLLCVCTHGRHDTCCAERGRPAAAALATAHPEQTWEVSHIGGDRFAGNLLVLPHGLYYGRLDPVSALAVAGHHAAGQLDLDHLRGRSGFAMPVQAAEIALRRELGETREGALRLLARVVSGADTEVVFAVGTAEYAVQVRSTLGPDPHRLTCRATRENPVPRHEVRSVGRR